MPQMRRPVLVATATVTLAFTGVLRAADDIVLDRFGAYLDSLRTQAAIPGLAAAIVGSNGVLRQFAFGWRNVDRSFRVEVDTPFHVDGGPVTPAGGAPYRAGEHTRAVLRDVLGYADGRIEELERSGVVETPPA